MAFNLVSYDSSDESDSSESKKTSDDVSQLSASSKRSKTRQPVRIGLPSVPDVDSDDESEPPDKKSRQKAPPAGSGVASFLPKPKAIQFGVAGRRGDKGKALQSLEGSAAAKNAQMRAQFMKKPKAEAEDQQSDDEDSTLAPSSFFSLESVGNVRGIQQAEGEGSSSLLGPQLPPDLEQYEEAYPSADGSQGNYVNPALYENDEAFKRLECGKKIKPKGQMGGVNIVDVNEQDQIIERLALQRKMATQQKPKKSKLSQESYDNADMKFLCRIPTTDMRRKHQMTWLVYQAHEREHLLEEQWAAQRATRRQTQAKYGF